MDNPEKLSLEQIQGFLEATQQISFQANHRKELYEWVDRILREYRYGGLKRRDKGMVHRYIAKMTGLSRAQVTRLIGCYRKGGTVQPRRYRLTRA